MMVPLPLGEPDPARRLELIRRRDGRLVVAALSYAGLLNLTAVADRDGCPDVEVFARGVRRALDDVARSVLVPAS
jgi:hypothetical protein